MSLTFSVELHLWEGAGTTGMALGVEALKLSVSEAPYDGGITYRSHVANQGWEDAWTSNGRTAGTTDKSRSRRKCWCKGDTLALV